MKKLILILLILVAMIAPFFVLKNLKRPFLRSQGVKQTLASSMELKTFQDNLLKYLKLRKEELAKGEIDRILAIRRDDICALWARAEILRRAYKFKESENLLNQVLVEYPEHAPSLVSLAYIKYRYNKFQDAFRLLSQALKQPDLDRENLALAYLIMGSINAKRATRGGPFAKVIYGTRIRGFFEKAKNVAPDMAEVRLGLGSFYLLAPKIAGGDIDKAIKELQCAEKLTPDFASVNARLAQAYKQKGDLGKYNFYIKRARDLEPANEILKELENQS